MITAEDYPAIEKRAKEIWREREMGLPERVRRMNPDAIDMATGLWWACMMKAGLELSSLQENIAQKNPPP